MATNEDFRVDSFHLNVATGDGAIHLLVGLQHNGGSPVVHRAVLIDGGYGKTLNDIISLIKYIQSKYHFPPMVSTLKFDSVVITHWDADHCNGVVALIESSLVIKKWCEYFKYDSSGAPETVLYAPYWYGKANEGTAVDGDTRLKRSRSDRPDGWTEENGNLSVFGLDKICKLNYSKKGMIGVNFFTNEGPKGVGFQSLTGRAELIKSMTHEYPVGMFCVCAFGFVIGNPFSTIPSTHKFGTSNKDLNDQLAFERDWPPMEAFVIDKLNEKRNHFSIGAIILWTQSGRVSHYFAGDAMYATESAVAKWINGEVTSMKLSHHGSDSSSPIDLLTKFKPRTIVVSAGTRHGHPSYQLLLWIHAWLMSTGLTDKRPVFAMRLPYYLEPTRKVGTHPNPRTFLNPDSHDHRFLKELKNCYDAISLASKKTKVLDIETQFDNWYLENSRERSKSSKLAQVWIQDQTAHAWWAISHMFQGLDNGREVFFNLVRSRDTNEDGHVTTVYTSREERTYLDLATKHALETMKAAGPFVKELVPVFPSISQRKMIEIAGRKKLKLSSMEIAGASDMEGDSPAGYHASTTSKPHYILYSKAPADQVDGVVGFRLRGDSPLDDFVGLLHGQNLGLESKPGASSSASLLPTDEWSCWLADAIAATSFITKTDEQGRVSGFSLQVKWHPDKSQTLKFSTDFIASSFNILPPLEGPPIGLLGSTDIMLMGLDMTQDVELVTNIPEALKVAGLAYSSTLFPQVSLKLSTAPAASNGARNGVWFEPGKSYRTTLRLQWDIPEVDKVKEYLGTFFKGAFELKSVRFITRRASSWAINCDGVSVISAGEAILSTEINVGKNIFTGALTFQKNAVRLDLTTKADVFGEILIWLANTTGDIPFKDWLEGNESVFKKILLRRVSLVMELVNGQRKLTDFSVTMEIALGLGADKDNPVRVKVTYAGRVGGEAGGKLRGGLWFSEPKDELDPLPRLLPDWEEAIDLSPATPGESRGLKLTTLHPEGVKNIPNDVSVDITEVSLEIDSESISFAGEISCREPQTGSAVPTVNLGDVKLSASYSYRGISKGKFTAALAISVTLPNPDDTGYPATLEGSLKYDAGSWTLSAGMSYLKGSALYSLFDPTARDGTLALLQNIAIRRFDMNYMYVNGAGNNFNCSGILELGGLELDLDYWHKPLEWEFSAKLGAAVQKSKLGKVIESITGEKDCLPPFVGDIPLEVTDSEVSIKCKKRTGPGPGNESFVFFDAAVKVGSLKATFAQYRHNSWAKGVPAKRFFKLSVTALPAIDIPLVGNLAQPFDEMYYMWVQDKSDTLPGLQDQEVGDINSVLGVGDTLVFKDTRKKRNQKDVVIMTGSHFVMVLKEKGSRKVIIDYAFASEKAESKMFEDVGDGELATFEAAPSSRSDASMAPYKKTAGPVSISNIGFQYKGNTLSILLDAAFLLGPVSFTLMGFSIDIDFNRRGATLQNLPLPTFSLSGLAVAFNKPPITISGVYRHVKNQDIEYYAGGVVIAVPPYLFQAAGFFGETKKPKPFTSVFVYAKLDGPLITLGFAEISGITGGFGYNTSLRVPAIADVPQFPFVAGTGVGGDVMVTLTNLATPDSAAGGWFDLRDGSFWVAAGLKVTAFETLSIDAVVVVQWNPKTKFAIFGVAVADIPRRSNRKFAHIELGISAIVDFTIGVMKVEAQLSPNSFIFDPSCHLTGGFALYYWFSGGADSERHKGDWVFTIGGFHRAYIRPAHYPNPPRLAISWSLDKSISITGEAYFAITPKCCMSGGRLSASLRLGSLTAWFDAYADFLINYKPFHFMGDGGITVGVRCKVDLLLTSFTLQAEIGAQLHLEGPPLCGRVHVDFWLMGFNIDFGPRLQKESAVSLKEFYEMALQASQSLQSSEKLLTLGDEEEEEEAVVEAGTVPVDKNAHVFGCRSGLLEGGGKQETPRGGKWLVRGGSFSFVVSCRVAINKATVISVDQSAVKSKALINSVWCSKEIFAKPMQLKEGLTSEITISVKRESAVQASSHEAQAQTAPRWQVAPVSKFVPVALWGVYDPDNDPANKPEKKGQQPELPNSPSEGRSSLLSPDSPSVELLMGVQINAPKPILSGDRIPKFSAVDAMSLGVNLVGSEPIFPIFLDSNPGWAPATVETPVPREQWGKVNDTWNNPPAKAESRAKTVTLWKEAMGWVADLSASAPGVLLSKFETYYMAAPMLSAG